MITNGVEKVVAAVTHSHDVNTNGYVDTTTTNHITCKLDKITVYDYYNDHDQVHIASGTCMYISHIGHPIIKTPCDKQLPLT